MKQLERKTESNPRLLGMKLIEILIIRLKNSHISEMFLANAISYPFLRFMKQVAFFGKLIIFKN